MAVSMASPSSTTKSTTVPVFEAHDEFEVALRCYGNDTIIQELDSFTSSNAAAKRRLLETLADMTRDTVVQKLQKSISEYSRDEWEMLKQQEKPCDPQCPLVQALVAYPMNIHSLYDSFLNDVRSWLSRWGRPYENDVEQFEQMILNHKQRMMEQQNQEQHEEENDGNATACQTACTESIKNDIIGHHHDDDDDTPKAISEDEKKIQKEEQQRTINDQTTATTRESLNDDNSGENNTNKSQCNHWTSSSSSSSLKRIQIQDLQLFKICQDCVLEGTLVTAPFTPMVGCTTLLQDNTGDIVLLALYNFIPSDVVAEDADALAHVKIPKGSKVQIKNPFWKIFRDGSRGIRIDNPQDICISKDPLYGSASLPTNNKHNNGDNDLANNNDYSSSTSTKAAAIAAATTNYFAVTKCKTDGNALFCQQMYHAASESYLTGLRKDDMTATLLSNRAQCFLNLEDWSNALGDAAASLVLRPHCVRSLSSYRVALTMIETMSMHQQQPSHNNATAAAITAISPLQTVLQDMFLNHNNVKHSNAGNKKSSMFNYKSGGSSSGPSGTTTASSSYSSGPTTTATPTTLLKEQQKGIDTIEKLNVRANVAFHNNDYHGAKKYYSRALVMGGAVTRATLCNWSLCSLMMGSVHDALAASVASLRISMMDDGNSTATTTSLHHLVKALLLLGEPSSAIHILREYPCKFNGALLQVSRRLETLLKCENTNNSKDYDHENSIQNARNVLDFPPSLLPNWSSRKIHTRIVVSTKEVGGTPQGVRQSKQQQGVKAICDIGENEVVLIERSLIWCKTSANENNKNNNCQNNTHPRENDTHDNMRENRNNINNISSHCPGSLQATIINRSERDGLISSIIDKLDDDGTASLPRLLATDGDSVPLFLPSHHEYMTKNNQRVHLTSKRVDGIVTANAITSNTHDTKGGEVKKEKHNNHHPSAAAPAAGRIGLYPALSIFRRSSSPPSSFNKKGQRLQHNCECHHRQQGSNSLYIVITNRKIQKDEELIIAQS